MPIIVVEALIVFVLVTAIVGTTFSLQESGQTISNIGSIKGIGVGIYGDFACANPLSSINWGLLNPGSSQTDTVYIKNEGNAPATLSEITQNWNPSNAANYMALTWNYAGQTLSPNQVLTVTLTLTVSQAVSGITSFTFDILVTATG